MASGDFVIGLLTGHAKARIFAAKAAVLALAALTAPVTAQKLTEVDIAVGFTAEALQAFDNDRERLEARIIGYRDSTNAMLAASGAPVRLNILAIEQLRGFSQTTFAADRRRFIDGERGGEAVEQLRDRTGADVRMLLVNYFGRGARVHYGGLFKARNSPADALKNAYVMLGTNADDMTFAHEFGHVLGCQHARRRSCLGARQTGLPFAYGFLNPEGIGTIMAGTCATRQRVPLYSSPTLSHRFVPAGEGQSEEITVRLGSETADCVRAMTEYAPGLAALNERRTEPITGSGPERVADLDALNIPRPLNP